MDVLGCERLVETWYISHCCKTAECASGIFGLKCRCVRGRPHNGTTVFDRRPTTSDSASTTKTFGTTLINPLRQKTPQHNSSVLSPLIEPSARQCGRSENKRNVSGLFHRNPKRSNRHHLATERTNTESNRFPRKRKFKLFSFNFQSRPTENNNFSEAERKKKEIEKRERWKSFK